MSLSIQVKSCNRLSLVLMKGLIIDTSGKQAIVGVMQGDILDSITCIDGKHHLSSVFFPAIEPLISDIDWIAIGVGPGESYMGLRAGGTVAKLLSYAKEIPLIPFSSILISIPKSLMGAFAFIGDAKMREYFLIEGEVVGERVRGLSAPQLIPYSSLDQEISKREQVVLASHKFDFHFHWVVPEIRESLQQQKTLLPEELSLNYVR